MKTKRPRVSEKVEQQHGIDLVRSIGGKVYVIGHPSPKDGRTFRGTGQTPGIPDVFFFLPPRLTTWEHRFEGEVLQRTGQPVAVWWEAKAVDGRLRPEQRAFRDLCVDAGQHHVVGPLDALIKFLIEHHYVKAENVPHYRRPRAAEETHPV